MLIGSFVKNIKKICLSSWLPWWSCGSSGLRRWWTLWRNLLREVDLGDIIFHVQHLLLWGQPGVYAAGVAVHRGLPHASGSSPSFGDYGDKEVPRLPVPVHHTLQWQSQSFIRCREWGALGKVTAGHLCDQVLIVCMSPWQWPRRWRRCSHPLGYTSLPVTIRAEDRNLFNKRKENFSL